MVDSISPRREIANRISSFIIDNNLSQVYGGDVKLIKNSYHVNFSRPCLVDGTVEIYSDKFILISFKTRYIDLPNYFKGVFSSEELALEFLRLAFVDLNFMGALEVPMRG